jgi:uncharacterized protein (TIGR03435 family)
MFNSIRLVEPKAQLLGGAPKLTWPLIGPCSSKRISARPLRTIILRDREYNPRALMHESVVHLSRPHEPSNESATLKRIPARRINSCRHTFSMMPALASASLGVLLSTAAIGQAVPNPPVSSPVARPEFEVASVKPLPQRPRDMEGEGRRGGGGCRESFKMDRGRVLFECATLPALIGYAFRFSPDRVKGPDWMTALGAPRFNITAKLPQGASDNRVPEMLQALLADRFKLAIHRGNTERAIYALVVAKGGLKAREAPTEADAPVAAAAADPDVPHTITAFGDVQTRTTQNADGSGYTTTISNPHMGTVRETDGPNRIQRWEAPSITFEGLADLLDRVTPLSSPVIDTTGLKGRYRVVLEVSLNDAFGARPAMTSASGDPTAVEIARTDMEAALLKGFNDGLRKLGLQLERRKGPVETVVVDRVEKTPTEN